MMITLDQIEIYKNVHSKLELHKQIRKKLRLDIINPINAQLENYLMSEIRKPIRHLLANISIEINNGCKR